MKLEVLRFSSQEDCTNGVLFDVTGERRFLCYTLEDEERNTKVEGETRIPAGTYDVTLRKHGGFHAKYTKRFPDIHRGMLWIRNVPDFEYILIHCGNTDEHTSGCLLVGQTQESNVIKGDGFVGKSSAAYRQIYPAIAGALEAGDKVTITYTDYG
jgi:hypothetical protein